MDYDLLLELLAILVLVLANSFFALAEFSVVASRSSRLAQKKAEGKLGASAAQKLRSSPERFLASIQVGITLVAAMMGVFSGATLVSELKVVLIESEIPLFQHSAASISMAIVVIGITVLSVVIGELVPKYIALTNPERYARYIATPITIFTRVTAPFSRLLSLISNLIVRMFGFRQDAAGPAVTDEEINQMIVEGRKKGAFDDTELEFVRSVFDFNDSTVRRAMTPRTDVVALEKGDPPERVVKAIVEHGYSRYPVFDETVDKVIGVLYTKDLTTRQIEPDEIDLPKIMREPLYVPDSMPLPRLLREFQKGKGHLAIVLDEFGGTAGLITLEDILEELVGEIQDEYDAEAAPLVKHSDSMLYANADVWPGDANELLETHLPEEDHDTLAGLIMEELGRLPEKQESVQIEDVKLTVLAKDQNRLLRLKLEKVATEDED
jgi:putative hemolysin